MLPWWDHLFRGGEMWTIAVRQQDRLLGLAPLFIHGIDTREVSFIGSGVTDYLGFLTGDENAAEITQQICEYIVQRARCWQRCSFVDLPADSPLLKAKFDTRFHAQRSAATPCPMVDLPPCLEALEASLSPKFRHHLRNAANRVRDLGGSFETASAGQDREYTDALIRLHSERWQSRGEAGVLATEALQNFLREMIAGFRHRGWLRFHGLRYEGDLLGVVCIFCARRRSHYYLGGFDDRLARYSPGNLLVRFAIQEAIREGSSQFDFLRNGERYKYRWGAQDRLNWNIIIDQESSAGFR